MTGLWQLGVSSPVSYAIAVVLPAFDALIPVLPSETAVIALGVATANSTDPRALLLVALAAAGAFLGDNAAYLLGRRFGPAASRRVFAGERGARRREWAQRSLTRYGARIIIGCRFIPGGRTAITLTCGLVGYSQRRFIAATACAAVIWASYAFLIGRLGGQAFADRPWAGLLLALGLTVAASAVIEAARRAWGWRRRLGARSQRCMAEEEGGGHTEPFMAGDRALGVRTGLAGVSLGRATMRCRAQNGRAGRWIFRGCRAGGFGVASTKTAIADGACVSEEQTLRQAGHLMRELGVEELTVRGEDGESWGVISEDMLVRRIAAGGDPKTVTVGETLRRSPLGRPQASRHGAPRRSASARRVVSVP